jgi:hypothetical protein
MGEEALSHESFDLGDLGLDELVQTLDNAKERAVVLLN